MHTGTVNLDLVAIDQLLSDSLFCNIKIFLFLLIINGFFVVPCLNQNKDIFNENKNE